MFLVVLVHKSRYRNNSPLEQNPVAKLGIELATTWSINNDVITDRNRQAQ